MQCTQCKYELGFNFNFCPKCGIKVPPPEPVQKVYEIMILTKPIGEEISAWSANNMNWCIKHDEPQYPWFKTKINDNIVEINMYWDYHTISPDNIGRHWEYSLKINNEYVLRTEYEHKIEEAINKMIPKPQTLKDK